jgi:hypothetical protein
MRVWEVREREFLAAVRRLEAVSGNEKRPIRDEAEEEEASWSSPEAAAAAALSAS